MSTRTAQFALTLIVAGAFAAAPAAASLPFEFRGAYAGSFQVQNGGAGELAARFTDIQDGTNNTHSLTLTLGTGRQAVSYELAGRVAANGAFTARGVAADGSTITYAGYIEQDNLHRVRVSGQVQIHDGRGQLQVVISIIAILIG